MKSKPYPEKQENLTLVSEPMSIYLPKSFVKNTVLENLTQNSIELFTKVLKNTNLTIKTLAENIFEITPKTFIKYKNNNSKIPSRIAELAIEINILYDLGSVVFSSADEFNNWLNKENIQFDFKKPANFLNTSTGIHLIYEELKRIEFGATA